MSLFGRRKPSSASEAAGPSGDLGPPLILESRLGSAEASRAVDVAVAEYRQRQYPLLPLVVPAGYEWLGPEAYRPDQVLTFSDRQNEILFVAISASTAGATLMVFDLAGAGGPRDGHAFARDFQIADPDCRPSSVEIVGPEKALQLAPPPIDIDYLAEIARLGGVAVNDRNLETLGRQAESLFLAKLAQFLETVDPSLSRRFVGESRAQTVTAGSLSDLIGKAASVRRHILAYTQDLPQRARAIMLDARANSGTFWEGLA